ncbi:sodium- and chloride-dependent GABA transporter 3 isoform X2 [Gadus morhua]|uniref:sodium- and chloride-dependent GABA transporter 3 isoform X2 n=1 Tax=Gadus morhua TaxID=8049 RepID=UPI0011B4F19A|nr:sodium- and chloride-dependent GABA transporter 3-like isoform X2 [Gadus morhua]
MEREQWTHKREYILAMAGNMVGLGNVWRFPYLCYKNGGGVFLLPYCVLALLSGVPLFLMENALGQFTQEGTITCWKKLCPLLEGVGYAIMVIRTYSTIYLVILAYSLFYLLSSFASVLPWTTCSNDWNTDGCVELTTPNMTSQHYAEFGVNSTSKAPNNSAVMEFWERRVLSMSGGIEELGSVQWELCACLLACWLACYFCIWKGVKSTGKVVYVTAVFPYVMLAILLVRGLTLPGAWQGVVYYLRPDFTRLTRLQVWIEAGTQVFYSYGVAAGTINTLGSYNKKNNNCYKDSLWLCALNSATSFVAGFAVFSILGFMAHQQDVTMDNVVESGPGLAFIAFPQAVAMMPVPQLWAVCFFIMLIMLGLDTLGGIYVFQLLDYYGGNGACQLCVALAECVAVGWAFGADRMCDAIKDMGGQRPCILFKYCWLYITPLLCLASFIHYTVESEPLTSNRGHEFPGWAYGLGWVMAFSSVFMIPLWAILNICRTKGSLRERLSILCRPVEEEYSAGLPCQTEMGGPFLHPAQLK